MAACSHPLGSLPPAASERMSPIVQSGPRARVAGAVMMAMCGFYAGGPAVRTRSRSHASPRASIFAHRSGGMRIDRCTSLSASPFGGRPPLRCCFSMLAVYVIQKVLAPLLFL